MTERDGAVGSASIGEAHRKARVAYDKADTHEKKAERLRERASDEVRGAVVAATKRLIALNIAGELPPRDVLSEALAIHVEARTSMKPVSLGARDRTNLMVRPETPFHPSKRHIARDKRPEPLDDEEVLGTFNLLSEEGQPVLVPSNDYRQSIGYAGIITGEPVTMVIAESRDSGLPNVAISFNTLEVSKAKDGTAMVASEPDIREVSLRAMMNMHIGSETVRAVFDEAEFKVFENWTNRHLDESNEPTLRRLSEVAHLLSQIEAVGAPFNTTALDSALAQVELWKKRKRSRLVKRTQREILFR